MLDLFGDVLVTIDDLHAWVRAVAPAFCSSERSLSFYIDRWNVVDKVRRAKLDGTFDATIENARARRAFLAHRYRIAA